MSPPRSEGAAILEDFIEELTATVQGSGPGNSSPLVIILALALAAVLGAYLALVYHWTYTGKKGTRGQMVYTIVLLCLGGSLVWLIVANNLVRAFGLAGALAMIRYRTRMQDPKDTTMVFFAIIVGMACGLHQYFTAIWGSFFIGVVLWIMKLVNEYTGLGGKSRDEALPGGAELTLGEPRDADEDGESSPERDASTPAETPDAGPETGTDADAKP